MMAATDASAQSTRMFHKLQSIHFYMERHLVEHHQIITKINKCQTKDAMKLRIRNIVQKSKQDKLYYLGSTYFGDEEHLWFYMRIIATKGEGCVLNIFVIHKKVEELSICMTFRDTVSRSFESARPGENYHLKTIKMTENDLNVVKDNPFLIPISIEISYSNEEEKRARIQEVVEVFRHQREEADQRIRRPMNGKRAIKPPVVGELGPN